MRRACVWPSVCHKEHCTQKRYKEDEEGEEEEEERK